MGDNAPISNTATATVRVVADPTLDCTDLIGKVFDDANLNGYQDTGELALPAVRVVTARGLQVTTDQHGRYHIACAVVPNETRGSNFIVKLDERSLPTGYRITTENPRVVRATRGKVIEANFGAGIHRVVRLDVADEAFMSGSQTDLAPEWQSGISQLIEQLEQQPSLLRLVYILGEEGDKSLAEARLDALKDQIKRLWDDNAGRRLNEGEEKKDRYDLEVETNLFRRQIPRIHSSQSTNRAPEEFSAQAGRGE